MERKKVILLLLIGIIFIFLLNQNELFGNYKTTCESNWLPGLLKTALEERDIVLNKKEWDYFIPCSYNQCEKYSKDVEKELGTDKKQRKLFMVDGCDKIASKLNLWYMVEKRWNDRAVEVMPKTFSIRDNSDLSNLKQHFEIMKKKDPYVKYILKNHKQRQEGLKIINDINEIEKFKKDFVLAQHFLNNPFILNGRKINFRYYTLIVCKNGKVNGYIYRNGFVYYTPKFFDRKSMETDRNITTGYIDRKVYQENPLTLEDFREFIGKEKAEQWDKEVRKKFKMMMEAIEPNICLNKKDNNIRFQLFGSDIAPSRNLKAQFMEINKGPDVGAKDDRDKDVKLNMLRGLLEIVENDNLNEDILKKIGYEMIY
jgi:hypothetical protein